jgi:hypothetical protein
MALHTCRSQAATHGSALTVLTTTACVISFLFGHSWVGLVSNTAVELAHSLQHITLLSLAFFF